MRSPSRPLRRRSSPLRIGLRAQPPRAGLRTPSIGAERMVLPLSAFERLHSIHESQCRCILPCLIYLLFLPWPRRNAMRHRWMTVLLVCATFLGAHLVAQEKLATLMSGLGDLHHPVSTTNAEAQQ